eukprot:CAMPEP_0172766572 /NCGR_PEP_ID=MMETSP1074-20121228/181430_1 /TAXON_ID=2916 /ORGANISM="Ceratium fusus, Strain PA161109" /LENGTH=146 /DNA_ID=CAMNT_0013601699 /DNA_START=342 /DNA_END=783 /DNA_ORIENTATION=-
MTKVDQWNLTSDGLLLLEILLQTWAITLDVALIAHEDEWNADARQQLLRTQDVLNTIGVDNHDQVQRFQFVDIMTARDIIMSYSGLAWTMEIVCVRSTTSVAATFSPANALVMVDLLTPEGPSTAMLVVLSFGTSLRYPEAASQNF